MTTISKSALVNYSAAQMFELVDNITAYPEFLPWCGGAQELSRDVDEVRAAVAIAYSGLNKSFTTRNLMQTNKMIEMTLIDGPFKHLHGFWRFDTLADDACKVRLDLEYEFSSKLVGLALGPVFGQIANSLVDSFCQRAETIYR